MVSEAEALLSEISSASETSCLKWRLDDYMTRIDSLRKSGGVFTAATAKTEGPSLIKVVNLCLKQSGISKEDNRGVQLLLGARRGISFLRGMQTSLTCSPFDLEKLAQNVVHKLIERGQHVDAQAETEIMIQKLVVLRTHVKQGSKTKGDSNALSRDQALHELLQSREAKKAATKDECALLLGCVVNTLTLETHKWAPDSGKQLLSFCGRQCLLWLKDLASTDLEMSKRLAGSLYRLSTKAASLVDSELKEAEKKSSGGSSGLVAVSRGLREVGMVYLLLSGRVQVGEIVQQVLKTARFYESRTATFVETCGFHLFLLAELESAILASGGGAEAVLSVLDWETAAVGAAVRAGAWAEGGELLDGFGRVLGKAGSTQLEGVGEAVPGAVSQLLRVAIGLCRREGGAARAEETAVARDTAGQVASLFERAQAGGGAQDEPWLERLGRGLDVLRNGCSGATAIEKGGAGRGGAAELGERLEAMGWWLRGVLQGYGGWLVRRGRPDKGLETLLTSLQVAVASSGDGEEGRGGEAEEMALVAEAVEQGGAEAQRAAVQASAGLYNLAVAHYNGGRMEAAVGPLRMACEVAMGREGARARGGGGLGVEESRQLGRRVCMLTYVLHRLGRVGEALGWAAAGVVMQARAGEVGATTRALEEYYTLAGSAEGGGGERAGGILLGELGGVEESVVVAALQAELRTGMQARHPPVKDLVRVCDALLEQELLGSERDPLGRGRVLLEKCKLQRAGARLQQAAADAGKPKPARKGGRGKAGAKKEAGGANGGGGMAGLAEQVEEVLELVSEGAREAARRGGGGALAEACEEMAIALTWKAVVLLDEGWGGHHGAAQSAVGALQLWHGLCSFATREGGAGGGEEGAGRRGERERRVQEQVQLLGDVLALHGQEALALHAKRCAVTLLCRGGEGSEGGGRGSEGEDAGSVRRAFLGRLAVEYGLKGYGEMAAMCAEGLRAEMEGGGGGDTRLSERSLLCVARASARVGAGDGGGALLILKELEADARERFQKVKREQRRGEGVGGEELCSMVASLRCEALLQEGDGVGALREGVAALHAQLHPVRHLLSRKGDEQRATGGTGARRGDADEEAGEGAKGGGTDAGALGEAVRGGGREASGWRVIEQVCERLWRVGEVHMRMGLGREGAYYLNEGLELGRGSGSVAWALRFGGMLAELQGLMGQEEEGAVTWEAARALAEEAAAGEAPSLAFLEADRARLQAQHAEWTRRGEGWGGVCGELEEALGRAEAAVAQEGGRGIAVSACIGVPKSQGVAAILQGLRSSAVPGDGGKGRKTKAAPAAVEAVGHAFEHTEVSRRLRSLKATLEVRLGEALLRAGRREEAERRVELALQGVPEGEPWLRAESLCVLGALRSGASAGEGGGGHAPQHAAQEASGEEAHAATEAELSGSTVVQLKARLSELGLPTSGKKAELVARILKARVAPAGGEEGGGLSGRVREREAAKGRAAAAGAGAVEVLVEAWRLLHPNGPPLLVKDCARTLLQADRRRVSAIIDPGFLAMASIGVTVRQQLQGSLRERKEKEEKGGDADLLSVCESVRALSVGADGAARGAQEDNLLPLVEMTGGTGDDGCEGRGWVRALQACLPETWAVVVVRAEKTGDDQMLGLEVVRVESKGEVQQVQLAGEGEESFAGVLAEFDMVMEEQKKGLESGGSVSGDEEKKQWWQSRVALDKRLGALLQRLERVWIGEQTRLLAPPGGGSAGGHAVLVLDESVQRLPWEAVGSLRQASVSRLPAAALLCYLTAGRAAAAERVVDSSAGYYVLNPAGDLAHTQAKFEPAFRLQPWEGVVGTAPTEEELTRSLRRDGVFVFCGHGAGERYLRGERVRGLQRCAAAVLMGCGSARLKPQGALEPRGMVLNYMLGGCPLAVGNLWDVSDRDIDRFADCLLRRAVLPVTPPAAEPGGEPNKSLNFSEAAEERCSDLVQGVVAARGAVRMKHLIGAAPVCFGLPVACVAAQG